MFLLLACTPEDTAKNDTSVFTTGCDRIHDTTGVLMFELGEDIATHTPDKAPSDSDKTTSVAGPMGDGTSYVLVEAGKVRISEDEGCNWSERGSLPSGGDWDLVAAGSRIWAFDRASASGAHSDDEGLNWSSTTLPDPPVGEATVDPASADRVRVVTRSGVVTTEDAGASWYPAGELPAAFVVEAAAVAAADLDLVLVGGPTGLQYSATGGQSWTDLSANFTEPVAITGLAVSPTDASSWYASGVGPDGGVILRSLDRGDSWSTVTEESSVVELGDAPPVWAVAGDAAMVVSASADADGVNLYVVTAGVGTEKVGVGTYLGITDVAATADHVLASVHAVAE